MFDFSFSGTDHFVIENGVLLADYDTACDHFAAQEQGTAPNSEDMSFAEYEEARANLYPCGKVTRIVFEVTDEKTLVGVRVYTDMDPSYKALGCGYQGWHEWDITELAPTDKVEAEVLKDLRELYTKCAAIRTVKQWTPKW